MKILNHGGFINRNSDEKNETRKIGVLMSNGSVKRVKLDQSKDAWKDAEELLTDPTARLTDTEFIKDLSECGPEFFDFCGSVLRHLRKQGVRDEVQKFVTNILKKAKEGK